MEQFWVAGRWLDLAIHMTKPQKGHSQTYTFRPPPKLGPPLVPVREFPELHFDQQEAGWGQDWAAGSSSCWLSWSCFCRSWDCPSGWRRCEIAATFIGCTCWHDMSWTNGCSSCNHSYTEVIFSILVGRDKFFWHSVILIMRFVLRETYIDGGYLTFQISEKSQYTSDISRSGVFTFLCVPRFKMGWAVQGTYPLLLYCFLNME